MRTSAQRPGRDGCPQIKSHGSLEVKNDYSDGYLWINISPYLRSEGRSRVNIPPLS